MRYRVPTTVARRGLSLLELVVVLAILGPLGAIMGMTLLRQQRFYRGATDTLHARETVRDAIEVMSTDIRGMSSADTVRLLADSAIEFFAAIGSSVVCQVGTGNEIDLPPAISPRDNTLTALLATPDSGDLAFLYVEEDTKWERHRITGLSARAPVNGCATFRSAQTSRQASDGFVLSLATPPTARIKPGAPVRFVRRGRYSLYRSSDGDWYLGYRRCAAIGPSDCGGIQPVSGPYRPYSANPASTGLLFEYFDAHGAKLGPGSSPLDLTRVDISVRSESREKILVEGRARGFGDSATVAIALRNRWP